MSNDIREVERLEFWRCYIVILCGQVADTLISNEQPKSLVLLSNYARLEQNQESNVFPLSSEVETIYLDVWEDQDWWWPGHTSDLSISSRETEENYPAVKWFNAIQSICRCRTILSNNERTLHPSFLTFGMGSCNTYHTCTLLTFVFYNAPCHVYDYYDMCIHDVKYCYCKSNTICRHWILVIHAVRKYSPSVSILNVLYVMNVLYTMLNVSTWTGSI